MNYYANAYTGFVSQLTSLSDGLGVGERFTVHHWWGQDVELGGWLDLAFTVGVWAGAVCIAWALALALLELSDLLDLSVRSLLLICPARLARFSALRLRPKIQGRGLHARITFGKKERGGQP